MLILSLSAAEYKSEFTGERIWSGPEFWARTIEAWRVKNNRIEIAPDTHGKQKKFGQSLNLLTHYLNEHEDSGFSFCVPSISTTYPRRWVPDKEGLPIINRIKGAKFALPEVKITRDQLPVLRVTNCATGKIIYSRRLRERSFKPHVFTRGEYLIELFDDKGQLIQSLKAHAEALK